MPQKLILDVDTGTDDAVAIMLAALHPALELVGVTTVNGNVAVNFCTDNSLRVLDHIGRSDITVYEGADRPLVRTGPPIAHRYDDGGEKYHPEELPVPAARSKKSDKTAVEFLIETYRAATDPIVLMPVGPLTNVAAALAADPGFVKRVPELIIMGGGYAFGNVTATAEFNIWADAGGCRARAECRLREDHAGAARRHARGADDQGRLRHAGGARNAGRQGDGGDRAVPHRRA